METIKEKEVKCLGGELNAERLFWSELLDAQRACSRGLGQPVSAAGEASLEGLFERHKRAKTPPRAFHASVVGQSLDRLELARARAQEQKERMSAERERDKSAFLADPAQWCLDHGELTLLGAALIESAAFPASRLLPALTEDQKRRLAPLIASEPGWRESEEFKAAAMIGALEMGADPNARDRKGEPALIGALNRARSEGRRLPVARVLASRADASLTNKTGAGPLSLACSRYAALDEGLEFGALELCALLVARGADVNEDGSRGQGPLHQAALARRGDVCAWLVERGADLEALCLFGFTPLSALESQSRSDRALDQAVLSALRCLQERQDLGEAVGPGAKREAGSGARAL